MFETITTLEELKAERQRAKDEHLILKYMWNLVKNGFSVTDATRIGDDVLRQVKEKN